MNKTVNSNKTNAKHTFISLYHRHSHSSREKFTLTNS